MAPTRDQGCDRMRRETGDPQGVRGKADVIRSREGESRAAQRRQAVPERHLGPGPAQPEARCESSRAVAEAFVTPGGLRRQPIEQGAVQPRVEKMSDIARGFELVGEGLVRLPPVVTLRRILNARGDADEHGMEQGQFRFGRDMKCHSCTQRISEQVEWLVAEGRTNHFCHEASGRGQVRSYGVRTAVTRKIRRDHCVRSGHVLPEATPEPSRLRESVQHDERWPRPAHLDVEWHDG